MSWGPQAGIHLSFKHIRPTYKNLQNVAAKQHGMASRPRSRKLTSVPQAMHHSPTFKATSSGAQQHPAGSRVLRLEQHACTL